MATEVTEVYLVVTSKPLSLAAADHLPVVYTRPVKLSELEQEDLPALIRRAGRLLNGEDADGAE